MPSYSIIYNDSITTPTRAWIPAIVPRLLLLQNLGGFANLGEIQANELAYLCRAPYYVAT